LQDRAYNLYKNHDSVRQCWSWPDQKNPNQPALFWGSSVWDSKFTIHTGSLTQDTVY